MTDRTWKILFQVYEALPRQGPGSRACTERALEMCEALPHSPEVLDLGCGNGAQTLVLAERLSGHITAVDSHAPNISSLDAKLRERELASRVSTRVADMGAPTAAAGSLDLVWSEGALYNIGIRKALELYAPPLRSGGFLVFTEAVWRSTTPSSEVKALFADYPTMGSIEDVRTIVNDHGGFSVCEHFSLPNEAWWDDFYGPMERRIATLREDYANDEEALAILEQQAREPELHRRFGDQYGYEFFVLRRHT